METRPWLKEIHYTTAAPSMKYLKKNKIKCLFLAIATASFDLILYVPDNNVSRMVGRVILG